MVHDFKNTFPKWLDWLQNEKRITDNTFDAYKRDLTKWSEFSNNVNHPKKIDFRSYMAFLVESGNSRHSIARKISSIRNFYRFASKRGFLISEDLDLIKTPKLPDTLPRSISKEDVDLIIDSIGNGRTDWEGARDKALLFLLYGAGLRISEALSIYKNQCPLGDWLRVEGKGGKHRDVPILKIVSETIQDYLSLLPKQFLKEEYLFIGKRGGKLSPRIIQRIIQKLRIKLNLPEHATPHSLRHAFATQLLAGGDMLRLILDFVVLSSLSTRHRYTSVEVSGLIEVHKNSHPRSQI